MTPEAFADRGLLWLLDGVASAHDVTPAELLAHTRRKRATAARHDLWRRLRERGWSYPEIGALCGFDHTTVMSALSAKARSKAEGPPPARKVLAPIDTCKLCGNNFEPREGEGRAYCLGCHKWRRKCWTNGVEAPRAGAAE